MEATATDTRYSTTTLRSGKVAVIDNDTRRGIVRFVGTPDEVDEFLADYHEAMIELAIGAAEDRAYAEYRERLADSGSWFGAGAFDEDRIGF